MPINFEDALTFVRTCHDSEELRDLNRVVVDQLRSLQRNLAASFRPGDEVEFVVTGKRDYKLNGVWRGKVTRITGKAVAVYAKRMSGQAVIGGSKLEQEWRVGPAMLRKVGGRK